MNKKLKLEQLELKSFVTSQELGDPDTLKGGVSRRCEGLTGHPQICADTQWSNLAGCHYPTYASCYVSNCNPDTVPV